jgi:hypothetical protein
MMFYRNLDTFIGTRQKVRIFILVDNGITALDAWRYRISLG